MAITGYVSYKHIIGKIYRDLGLTTEVSESTVVEWIAEVLEKIGTYFQYNEVNSILTLDEGKTQLPLGFYKIIDLQYEGVPLSWSSNSFIKDYACEDCRTTISNCCTPYSFYINNGYIITDVKEASPKNTICISYLGIPVDEEGYPLVPNDIHFIEACVKYATYMMDYREWRKGNVPDKVFQKSESEYLWYVGAAKGAANMPNKAQMDNLKNVLVRLIPNQGTFRNDSEQLKRH